MSILHQYYSIIHTVNHFSFQTPPSGYGGPGVLDELVYSGAGSGCRDDDEDACVLPDAGSGDDLITPVYVPSTRRPPTKIHKVEIGNLISD